MQHFHYQKTEEHTSMIQKEAVSPELPKQSDIPFRAKGLLIASNRPLAQSDPRAEDGAHAAETNAAQCREEEARRAVNLRCPLKKRRRLRARVLAYACGSIIAEAFSIVVRSCPLRV